MRNTILLVALIFPSALFAQFYYAITGQVTSGARLLSINGKTILIQQQDLASGDQKWTSYDEIFNVTANKKLVTPDAKQLASQTYYEGTNNIIRVDQFLIDGQLQISMFSFDPDGNLLKGSDLELESTINNLLHPIPFYLIRSPDRKLFSLVQAANTNDDSLQIRTVVFDEDLHISGTNCFRIPFDADLFDFYLPLINNEGYVSIISAEKFTSYRLNSLVNCFFHKQNESVLQELVLTIPRKKLKAINFFSAGDTIGLQALYSHSTTTKETRGVMYAGFNLKGKKIVPEIELPFPASLGSELKKVINPEGRKGSLVNYISLLPANFEMAERGIAGYLLPAQKSMAVKYAANVSTEIERFQRINADIAATRSLIGRQPAGFSKPMNAAQANAYASLLAKPPAVDTSGNKLKRQDFKKQHRERDFIYFSSEGNQLKENIIKLKTDVDGLYDFFSYFNSGSKYGAVYYSSSTFGKPVFKVGSFDAKGELIERNAFADSNKVILPDLPFNIFNDFFIGFFEDRLTREIGILKVHL